MSGWNRNRLAEHLLVRLKNFIYSLSDEDIQDRLAYFSMRDD
jgi:hypothetical protein